jgi:hypothetical protein
MYGLMAHDHFMFGCATQRLRSVRERTCEARCAQLADWEIMPE